MRLLASFLLISFLFVGCDKKTGKVSNPSELVNSKVSSGFILSIGGVNSEQFTSVIETSEKDYLAVGYTTSDGAGDVDSLIVKLNSSGEIVWDKTVGGRENDTLRSVIETSNGDYLAVGYTTSEGDGDAYIVKFGASGSLLMCNTIRRDPRIMEVSNQSFSSVIETSDGNYIAVGDKISGSGFDFHRDGLIVKFNSNNSILWGKYIGNTEDNYLYSVIETSDGNYLAIGKTHDFSGASFIVKLDSFGEKIWIKTIPEGSRSYNSYPSIIETSDGNYLAVGATDISTAGRTDGYIVKINSSGEKVWAKTIGGSEYDEFSSVIETSNGDYLAVGYTSTGVYAREQDGFIVKINSSGEKVWTKTISSSNCDMLRSVIETSNGDYLAVGYTCSDASSLEGLIVKLNKNGNIPHYSSSRWRINDADNADTIRNADSIPIASGEDAEIIVGNISSLNTRSGSRADSVSDADDADTVTK